jgi:hypothetical protein
VKELLALSEKKWQALVVQMARTFGYLSYHTLDSRKCAPGYPDLTLVGHGRLIYAELKKEKGRLSPAQKVWLEELGKTCAEVYVWRPSQYKEVRAILEKGEVSL